MKDRTEARRQETNKSGDPRDHRAEENARVRFNRKPGEHA
jgi:hypothetical protein